MRALRIVLLLAVLAAAPLTCHYAPRLAEWAVPQEADPLEEMHRISQDHAHKLEGLPPDSPEAWRLRAERNRKLSEVRRRLGLPEPPGTAAP